jgi:hypothetical protein
MNPPTTGDGGTGGGSLLIQGYGRIDISGTLLADGRAGETAAAAGGGGAGGLISLLGDNIDLTGTLSARGGAGGGGIDQASDGGGGGGGGRIKVFRNTSLNDTSATRTVAGGAAGTAAAMGADGSVGTNSSGMIAFTVSEAVSAEITIF